ncbi:hypothetical protein KFE25_000685 [Diacronema lutheri]|uniref:Small-subunit processome Utp12 domain-containing protein n=1 Tax=Diacronema lutheri TaxID=2081491 RepID=A0A8J5XP40_DIALT|nr:hypothetical protein KFE25_000685 [Diacronema lutheri]
MRAFRYALEELPPNKHAYRGGARDVRRFGAPARVGGAGRQPVLYALCDGQKVNLVARVFEPAPLREPACLDRWHDPYGPLDLATPAELGEALKEHKLKLVVINPGARAQVTYESGGQGIAPVSVTISQAARAHRAGHARARARLERRRHAPLGVPPAGCAGAGPTAASLEAALRAAHAGHTATEANARASGNVVFTRDGGTLFSPVGNRVSAFDLTSSRSYTFPFEARANIARLALSPDGGLLLTVDEGGYALLVNVPKRTVLHHLNFKGLVGDAKFSPDGKFLLVAVGRLVQVWATPEIERTFTPFNLHHTHSGHMDDITTVSWSADSAYFVTGSKDLTARVFTVHRRTGYVPPTLGGHRSALVCAWFDRSRQHLYTVTRDGAMLVWARYEQEAAAVAAVARGKRKLAADELLTTAGATDELAGDESALTMERWELHTKHLFERTHGSVSSVAHCSRAARALAAGAPSGADVAVGSELVAIGFSSGAFTLCEMPGFVQVHSLSISDEHVTTSAINGSGEWLAFGCAAHGQLIVWEWASETYVLKQQGHFASEVNALAFSAAGAVIATGGNDAKVKLWDASSGFCVVTFTEHAAPVTGLAFVPHGRAFVSSSLDGTARAFDLVRYRNFQTFATPTPAQLTCVAVDTSGEVVTAGSLDTLCVYVWSMQSAQLVEQLSGHAKPIAALAFGGGSGSLLASAAWDGTVRLWDFVATKARSDVLKHSTDVLAIAFSPDGQTLCASTLDGALTFWDVAMAEQVGMIDGRKDIAGGKRRAGQPSAQNDISGLSFRTLSFSADGELLLAAGNSKYACMYDVRNRSLLKRYQLSHNVSLDGVLDRLHSGRLTDGGDVDLIDDEDDETMRARRGKGDWALPGVKQGEHSNRTTRRAVRATSIQFAPDGTAWAAATTEGLAIYSLDEGLLFDPTALDVDVTPASIRAALHERDFVRALLMALRLNEADVLHWTFEAIPLDDIDLVARQVPQMHLARLLQHVAAEVGSSVHLAYVLRWAGALMREHSSHIQQNTGACLASLRALQKGVQAHYDGLRRLSSNNTHMLDFLCALGPSEL